jgi:hypothetical protein
MLDSLNIAQVPYPGEFYPGYRYVATNDQGAVYSVLGPTEAGVIVRSLRVGALARIVQTGRVVGRDGQVRARLEFAVDTGDAAGTLTFDGDSIGCRVPAAVFAA